jgi:hypothetical protein
MRPQLCLSSRCRQVRVGHRNHKSAFMKRLVLVHYDACPRADVQLALLLLLPPPHRPGCGRLVACSRALGTCIVARGGKRAEATLSLLKMPTSPSWTSQSQVCFHALTYSLPCSSSFLLLIAPDAADSSLARGHWGRVGHAWCCRNHRSAWWEEGGGNSVSPQDADKSELDIAITSDVQLALLLLLPPPHRPGCGRLVACSRALGTCREAAHSSRTYHAWCCRNHRSAWWEEGGGNSVSPQDADKSELDMRRAGRLGQD